MEILILCVIFLRVLAGLCVLLYTVQGRIALILTKYNVASYDQFAVLLLFILILICFSNCTAVIKSVHYRNEINIKEHEEFEIHIYLPAY